MSETAFTSPIDGHIHLGAQDRNVCMVCQLQDQRDGLHRILGEKNQRIEELGTLLVDVEIERDRCRAAVEVLRNVPTLVEQAMAERDLLRRVVDAARRHRDIITPGGAEEFTPARIMANPSLAGAAFYESYVALNDALDTLDLHGTAAGG